MKNILKLLLLGGFIFALPVIYGAVPEYQRSISESLQVKDMATLEFKTCVVSNKKAKALILLPSDKNFLKSAKDAINQLEQKYQVKFRYISNSHAKINKPGNYIIFSNGNDSANVLRLKGNGLITGNKYGYEVRNIPNAFGRDCNILYFGGKKPNDLIVGMQRFLKKQRNNTTNLTVIKYIDLNTWNSRQAVDKSYQTKKVREISQLYKSNQSQKNTKAIRLLSNVSREYYKTGDEEIARTFMKMLQVYSEQYEGAKSWRKTPPSFRFQELVLAVDQIEESTALNAKDRLACAEILRRITEDCMNYWEMLEPMKLYDSGKIKFLTNHPLFASRGVNAASKYLLARCNIPAARYWEAVSAHAFKGIDQAPVGPEDAGCYQWFSRRIYTNYCINSGEMNYNTPNLHSYIDYALANINQMGVTASYGDTLPITGSHGWSFLKFGKILNDDKLCEYMLQRITVPYVEKHVAQMQLNPKVKYTPRMLGLTVFSMNKFLKKYFRLKNKKPILNKAVFRNGYTPVSEYLMLGGLNTQQVHGHMDANAIIQYSRGDRYWLLDGDYIKAFPREHNSIVISRNGSLPDQRRSSPYRRDAVAELDAFATSPNYQQAIIVSSLRDHAGIDWTRNIFWTSGKGFWIIDNLEAVKAGRYVIKCFWRTLGEVKQKGSTFEVTQKKSANPQIPWHFFIARGDDSVTTVTETLELGHSAPFGYYDTYKYASPVSKIITEQKDADLNVNEKQQYVNYFLAAPGDYPMAPQVHKVAKQSAWILAAQNPQLVIIEKFQFDSTLIKADKVLIDKNNLCAVNATQITIGGVNLKYPKPQNVYIEFGKDKFNNFTAVMAEKLLKQILAKASPAISVQKFKSLNVPLIKTAKQIVLPDSLRRLGCADKKIVCGFPNGVVSAYSENGKKLWQVKLKAGITAISPVKSEEKTFWAVGTDYDTRKKQMGYIALIDNKGKLLWQKAVLPYHGRNGTIRTITAAKLKPGNKQQIVVGSEAWKYLAFDQNGKKLWESPIFHAATVSAAGDMTGNGLDEVAIGTEYPYHWILSNKGKKLKTVLSSPGDYTVLVADIIGDNKKEAIWGREDGFIKIMRPGEKEKMYVKDINVGGLPTGIVSLPWKRLAVSTDNNTVVFLNADGQKQHITYLPAHLYDLKKLGKELFVICRDGYLYKLNFNGKILAKYKIPDFNLQKNNPLLYQSAETLILGYGKKLTLLK